MIWDGLTVLIEWGYRPRTTPAIKWHQRSDGNWRGSDRGPGEDIFSADITFRGPKSELTDLETVLNDNRGEFDATFNSGEEIFGADIDHTGTREIIVTRYGKIRHAAFKVFEMSLTVRLHNPVLKVVTGDFSKLRTFDHTDTRETVFELSKYFSYDNNSFIIDRLSNDGDEPGMFVARFTQNRDEMPAIRRYLLNDARAKQIPFPTFGGIIHPFGTRAGIGPFNCRIIKWEDLGRRGLCDSDLSITFARDLTHWNE